MKSVVRVDERNRVVIPSRIAKALRLKKGDALWVWVEEGRVVMEPAKSVADAYFGRYRIERWPSDLDAFLVEVAKRWWMSRDTYMSTCLCIGWEGIRSLVKELLSG